MGDPVTNYKEVQGATYLSEKCKIKKDKNSVSKLMSTRLPVMENGT